jgi:hypothetical protein
MIIIYIIIGYLISTFISILGEIKLIMPIYDKEELKNAETIGDFLNVIPMVNWIPFYNTASSIVYMGWFLSILLYKICKITKLTTLRSKFLNIRIRKNNKNK